MRILLVDDDEAFRATLRQLLIRAGRDVQVEEAGDGEEVVRRVSSRRPDVVLMDLTMPRVNGIEATRRLKTRWPDLPVMILTVHDDPVYERIARAAGADHFLLKKTAGIALWPALLALRSLKASRDPRPAVPSATARPRSRRGGSPGPGIGNVPPGHSGIDPMGEGA